MTSSKVRTLEEHRRRRERRLDRTLALHRGSGVRSSLVDYLGCLLRLTGGERAAAVWVDEYEGTRAHPFLVLDLAAEPPRRDLSVELLLRCWESGVPAIEPRRMSDSAPTGIGSWAVSLGSDGSRLWFLYFDSGPRSASLAQASREGVMFLAGECAALLLHRDLDSADDPWWPRHASIFPQPLDEESSPEARVRRSAVELARRLLHHGLDAQISLLSNKMLAGADVVDCKMEAGPAAYVGLARSVAVGDMAGVAEGLAHVALDAEDSGDYSEAAEIHGLTYELACSAGAVRAGGQAARGRARTLRRLAEWDDSERWYDIARTIAVSLADPAEEALVLDGVASSYLGRGRIPKARAVLAEAVSLARLSGDSEAMASVSFSLMTVAHTEGHLAQAAQHGWDAFLGFESDRGKLRALTALGGVFMAAGSLDPAEDAFAIVLRDNRDRHYRLYALAGLARVHAARGDLHAFERANLRLDEEASDRAAPEFRAEMLLERGDGYLELGLEEEARRWYHLAIGFSDRHGVNEYLMRAESALAELDLRGTADAPVGEVEPEFNASPDVDAICRDLGALRRDPASVES